MADRPRRHLAGHRRRRRHGPDLGSGHRPTPPHPHRPHRLGEGGGLAPDGSWLATASDDHTARIWDPATGQPLHTLTGHTGWRERRRLRPRRPDLATASDDTHRHGLGRHHGQPLTTLGQSTRGASSAFGVSGDRRRVVVAADRVTVHDVAQEAPERELDVGAVAITDLAFTATDDSLVSGDDHGAVRLWRADTGSESRKLFDGNTAITGVATSGDGRLVAAAPASSADVEIIELGDNDTRWQISDIERRGRRGVRTDGDVLAVAQADGTVSLWTRSTGDRSATSVVDDASIAEIATGGSAESWRVAAAYEDGTLAVADVTAKRSLGAGRATSGDAGRPGIQRQRRGSRGLDGTASASHRQRRTGSSSPSRRVLLDICVPHRDRLPRAGDGRCRSSGRQCPDCETTPSPPRWRDPGLRRRHRRRRRTGRLRRRAGGVVPWDLGETVSAGAPYGRSEEGDLGGGVPRGVSTGSSDEGDLDETVSSGASGESSEDGHVRYVNDVDYSPDGTRVASASGDGRGAIWDEDGNPTWLVGHEDRCLGIDFSPDGRLVATASRDGTIRMWDAATGDPSRDRRP